MNEIQLAQSTPKMTIVEEDLFWNSSSMVHCVSSDFSMGAGIAQRFDRLCPQMKTEASRELLPGSVFAFYDQFSRRWIYNLVSEPKYFHQPFSDALKNSLSMIRNHAEAHGLKNIRLPEIGCGLDKLQPLIMHKILREVCQKSVVLIAISTRRHIPL